MFRARDLASYPRSTRPLAVTGASRPRPHGACVARASRPRPSRPPPRTASPPSQSRAPRLDLAPLLAFAPRASSRPRPGGREDPCYHSTLPITTLTLPQTQAHRTLAAPLAEEAT